VSLWSKENDMVITENDVAYQRRLRRIAQSVRRQSLQMVHAAHLGHPGGDLSATDILVTLYFAVLRIDPAQPRLPNRDRFIMSKGHSSGALYATLASAGFFPPEDLRTYMQPGSSLNGHPHNGIVPGVEASTGPLGHGLPIAVGAALAARLDDASWRVFVLTGDGELEEGSNWESAMSAAHYQLDNLVLIIDRNRLQQGAETECTTSLEPLKDKWLAFGWAVREVDGHDYLALRDTLGALPFEPGRPSCLIAHTHKGQGVSFMRDQVGWHHRVPTDDELVQALGELEGDEW
jgi:transketolase